MRLSHFENKYKASVNKAGTLKPTVIFSPEVAKFKKEIFGKKALKATSKSAAVLMDLSTDKQRQRGYNDVLPEKKDTAPITGDQCFPADCFFSAGIFFFSSDFVLRFCIFSGIVATHSLCFFFVARTECSESGLSAMGNRLLDWFSVLMSQGGREKPIKNASKGIRFVIRFPLLCHPVPGHPTLRLFSIGPKEASGRGRKKRRTSRLCFPRLTRCVRFLSPPPPLVLVRRIDFPIKYCPCLSHTVFPFILTFVFFHRNSFFRLFSLAQPTSPHRVPEKSSGCSAIWTRTQTLSCP